MSEQVNEGPDLTPAEVTYSAADIAALNLAIWRFWLAVIGIIAAAMVIIPIVLVIIDGYSLGEAIGAIDWPFTALVLLVLLAWIIVTSVVSYWWRRRKGLHGPIQFALTEDGLSFRSRQMEGVAFWNAIKSVKRGRRRLYLFISRRVAFIVPRRAFAGGADFDRFASEAERRWNASRR